MGVSGGCLSMERGIRGSNSVRLGIESTDIGSNFRDGRVRRATARRIRADIPEPCEFRNETDLLVRAVETADAEVHDAGVEISAVARDRLGAGDGARHVFHANVRVSWRHERVWVCRFARFDIPVSSTATVSRVLGSQTKTRSQSFHTLTRFDWLGVKICARAM